MHHHHYSDQLVMLHLIGLVKSISFVLQLVSRVVSVNLNPMYRILTQDFKDVLKFPEQTFCRFLANKFIKSVTKEQ